MLVNILLKRFAFIKTFLAITLKATAFSLKAKRFNKMFTILALFILLRIAQKSHFYAPSQFMFFCFSK